MNVVLGRGVVEISDSGRYEETLSIEVSAQGRIELRAGNGHRPTPVQTGLGAFASAGTMYTAYLGGQLVYGGGNAGLMGVVRGSAATSATR